jgi:hypothetical protein
MKSSRRLFLSRLIWTFSFVLILVAVVPYQSIPKAIFIQQAKLPKNHSNIRFSKSTQRLGPVRGGEDAHGYILVENTGNKIIKEVEVLSNCQCSDIRLSKTTINPGEFVRVDFTINTKGRDGDFVLCFVVKYFEEDQGLFDVFYVTVPVLAPGKLIAEPPSLLFNRAKAGETFSRDIELSVRDLPENKSVDILDISAPNWISASLIKKDTDWKLTLSGAFPNQSGRFVEFIQIKLSSEQYSEMVIPVIVEYAAIPADDAVQ